MRTGERRGSVVVSTSAWHAAGRRFNYRTRHVSLLGVKTWGQDYKCGCTMGGRMINHLMYADDLVILSPSAKGLQRLVDICAAYGDIHDITFNHAKTACMYSIERQLYT